MTKKTLIGLFAALVVVGLNASPSEATRTSVILSSDDITAHMPENPNLGTYYVVSVSVPPEAARVQWAFLEFYVDVSSRASDELQNETPLFEVYALKGAFSGDIDLNQFQPQDLPTMRPVAVGSGRRVVMDITEIVKVYIANPASNHGLIVGSLTGSRDGLFTLRSGEFGLSSLGRITFFCTD
jgi:hypothetical protein